jgi:ribosome-associated protein
MVSIIPATTIDPTLAETDSSKYLALQAALAADDRKAADMLLIRVVEVTVIADYFLIVTGFSRAQLRAIAESIEAKVQEVCQREPNHVEGKNNGNWVLVDYGDVIVHVMSTEDREYYNLEAFWSHGEATPISFVPTAMP